MKHEEGSIGREDSAEVFLNLVRLMVDKPEKLRLEVVEDGAVATYVLYVSHSEIGKLIGKQGRTARSLRTILNVISKTTQQQVALDILEEPEVWIAGEG